MTLILRRAGEADIPAAADIFLAARRSILHIVPMVHPDSSVVPWMTGTLFPTHEMWLAVRDGRPAAIMALSPGWVAHLYGHPDFHGQGFGTQLLKVAKQRPQAAGGLQLWTFQGNSGARRFYERHGFIAVEFTDGAGNEEKTPDARYEWRP